jgi:hypothetical protein
MDKEVYVIEKVGYDHICVKLTENEARTLTKFLDWACLDEECTVTPFNGYEFEEWGEK